jgi:hypothetical protein
LYGCVDDIDYFALLCGL